MSAHERTGGNAPPSMLHAIVRQRGTTVERFILLGPSFILCGVHWDNGRQQTVPHLSRRCVPCESQSEVRLEGFASAYCQVRSKLCVMAFSRHAAQDLMFLRDTYGTLEGLEVLMGRQANASNGKVRCAFKAQHDVLRLPAPFDVRPTLCAIWGVPDVALLTDKLVVGSEMDGPGPEGGAA